MKLAFVVQRYGADFVGGAEKYVRSMATGLAAMGHDITVITSRATSYADWADIYPAGTQTDDGVTVHRVGVRAPRDNDRFIPLHLRAVDAPDVPLWPWAQERWAQTMGPELESVEPLLAETAAAADVTIVVGYHYSQSLWLTRVAAAYGPTMVIPTAHPEGAFHVGRVRQMFEHADRIVCLAPEEADLIAAVHGRIDRTSVVPCPVDDITRPDPSTIRAALRPLGLSQDRYAIVVGRVDPAKGSDDVIRFTAFYRRSIDSAFQLVVVGPGGEDQAPVEGVVATGFVSEETKTALVAGAGVMVQPSYMESFSLALMEGWLLQRPALIQRRSRVLAGHAKRSGGGISYADYLDFEAGLVTLHDYPDLGRAMGERGREYCLREFAWDRVARQFLEAAALTAESGQQRLGYTRSITR